jgi:hypothetical protein
MFPCFTGRNECFNSLFLNLVKERCVISHVIAYLMKRCIYLLFAHVCPRLRIVSIPASILRISFRLRNPLRFTVHDVTVTSLTMTEALISSNKSVNALNCARG